MPLKRFRCRAYPVCRIERPDAAGEIGEENQET